MVKIRPVISILTYLPSGHTRLSAALRNSAAKTELAIEVAVQYTDMLE